MTAQRVAIIGAGISGLAAAFALRNAPVEVDLFDGASWAGGRALTIERGTARFDTGAQFFRTETPAAEDLVLRQLPADDLLDIRSDVRPFMADGAIGEGDPAQNGASKWVYRQGIQHLATLLHHGSAATVHLNRRVERLNWSPTGWTLGLAGGAAAGPYGAILLTAPGGALRAILAASTLPGDSAETLAPALAGARYRSIISIGLGFTQRLQRPRPGLYALVNIDRAHPVSWLAYESEKPGYVPDGHDVLVVQMADMWSRERVGAPASQLATEALASAESIVGRLPRPAWHHVTAWREALPDATVPGAALQAGEPHGLFFAGDGETGGRVHLALESGLAAGGRIAAWFQGRG